MVNKRDVNHICNVHFNKGPFEALGKFLGAKIVVCLPRVKRNTLYFIQLYLILKSTLCDKKRLFKNIYLFIIDKTL